MFHYTFSLALLTGASLFAQSFTISTIAGGAPAGSAVVALSAALGEVRRSTVDSSGNVYFTAQNAVFQLSGSGLKRIAGGLQADYAGDGGPAVSALLNRPQGIAVDTNGNIYVADSGNNVIRMISNGVITTFAGDGTFAYSGDFSSPALARFKAPSGLAIGKDGAIYVADTNSHAVRKIAGGVITTIAGTGWAAFGGDTLTASNARLSYPTDVAVDGSNNVYIADSGNAAIREVKASDGTIATVAGRGTSKNGDGGAAISAVLTTPYSVAVDASGNLYIGEYSTNLIRKVDTKGNIASIVGTGAAGFANDGGDPAKTQLTSPYGVSVDGSGNLYIADSGNYRLRKVAGSAINTIAGNGVRSYSGDGGPALSAQLNTPQGVAVDAGGNVYFADVLNSRVRKVSTDGTITTIAGNGTFGFGGDGGNGSSAQLYAPLGIAVDGGGNVYITDSGNGKLRVVNSAGVMSSFSPTLSVPLGVTVDSNNNVFVTGYEEQRLWKFAGSATVLVAGDGSNGYVGDGGPAAQAEFDGPMGVAVDKAGNIFIADAGNDAIRKIGVDGNITTFAGIGLPGYDGDGGPAVLARIAAPKSIAVDGSGNLFVAAGNRIRLITSDGFIQTIAGQVAGGYAGDGGPALNAKINGVGGLAVDAAGNVYFSDSGNNVIRKLTRVP